MARGMSGGMRKGKKKPAMKKKVVKANASKAIRNRRRTRGGGM
jgi:hypothetical protein